MEYEYDINALTGEVVKYEQKNTGTSIPSGSASGDYIGEAAAKEAALAHAGVSEADVCWLKADFDRDDGVYYYELEFAANGLKYDYEINALTGDVVKFEQEQTGNLAGNGSGNSGSGTGTGAGTGNQYGNGASSVDTGSFIGEAAAKAAALSDAGVSESEVTRLKCELDRDHGSYKYEIEFNVRAGLRRLKITDIFSPPCAKNCPGRAFLSPRGACGKFDRPLQWSQKREKGAWPRKG